jgi:hypothetical protein
MNWQTKRNRRTLHVPLSKCGSVTVLVEAPHVYATRALHAARLFHFVKYFVLQEYAAYAAVMFLWVAKQRSSHV